MHKIECEALVDEIEAAENNEYYEEYFAIDNDAASDSDEIYIKPPYVIIDKEIIIPFQDMKDLLMEKNRFPRTEVKVPHRSPRILII